MALSRDTERFERDGRQHRVGVKAGATVYKGSLLEANGNHAQRATAGAGKRYLGISVSDQVVGGSSDGDREVFYRRGVAVKFKTIIAGRNTVPGLGADAYVHDDETVTGTNDVEVANTTDRSQLGKTVAVDDDGVWVEID